MILEAGLISEDFGDVRHNYVKKMRKWVRHHRELLQATKPGALAVVDVAHECGCAIFGGGFCGCRPELTVRLVPPEVAK